LLAGGGLIKEDMPMDETEKQALIEKTRADRGWVLPEQEFYINKDPEYHVRQSALYNHVIKREGVLSEKFRELIIIAALCVRLPATETATYVKNHMQQALELGATEDEIFETVQCLIFPAGGPSLMMGVKCLNAVLEERKASA
jgi:alkylhydroperoxidase/carboxymuconolactone decarboxylase family protein YurZ